MCTSWEGGTLLVEEYEALIKAFPKLNPELAGRVGRRTFRLSCLDFERHGFMDGCFGCRDISSGKKRTREKNGERKKGYIAPHNVACRRRMENAVREADPDRWARYLLRQRPAAADPRALEAAALRGGSSYSYSSSSSETLQLPSPPSPSPPSAPSPQSWACNLACWVARGRKRKEDEE